MDISFILSMVLIFAAVVLAIEGAYTWWSVRRSPEAQRLSRRIAMLAPGGGATAPGSSLLKHRALSRSPAIDHVLRGLPGVEGIDRWLQQSGLPMPLARLLAMCGAGFAIGLLAGLFAHAPVLVASGIGLLGALLPAWRVQAARVARLKSLEQQLPDALDLMGRSVRAGHAFPSALQMVAEEMPDPIGEDFRGCFDEINYGVSLPDALRNLALRAPIPDMRFFVVAVTLQRDTGGNLGELLDNIAALMRARFKLLGRIRVLSAEGRMSAWILGCMPFATAGAIQAVSPGFLDILFTDELGRKLVWGAGGMMLVGVLWMRRIIRIRV